MQNYFLDHFLLLTKYETIYNWTRKVSHDYFLFLAIDLLKQKEPNFS